MSKQRLLFLPAIVGQGGKGDGSRSLSSSRNGTAMMRDQRRKPLRHVGPACEMRDCPIQCVLTRQ
jgi:hypothetical protein